MVKNNYIIFMIVFILLSYISISKELKEIESISMKINETLYLNRGKKEKVYTTDIKFPGKIRKEMLEPEINKGEIYLYVDEKKTVYYPLLEQTIESEIEEDENYVFFVLKKIRGIDFEEQKNNNIIEQDGVKYFIQEGKISKIDFENGDITEFKKYEAIDDYNIPVEVEVFSNGELISRLYISEILVDSIDEAKFELK